MVIFMDSAFLNLFFDNQENNSIFLNGFIYRQPILNSKGNVVAYEITYKDPKNHEKLEVHKNGIFTDSILLFGMLEFSNKKRALLNIPKRFLESEIPSILPPEKVALGLNSEIIKNPESNEHIKSLNENNFLFFSDKAEIKKNKDIISKIKYIKLEFNNDKKILLNGINFINQLNPNCEIIIQNINTYSDYDSLSDLNVDLFQGPYFSTPKSIKIKEFKLSSNSISDLLRINLDEDFDFAKIAKVVKKDPAMTSRFLRLANSAGRKKISISSIDHALIYLGQYEVKKVITLFILTESANNKPEELCKLALIRAKFCEAVIKTYDPNKSFQAYLVGLLSVLDAIFDFPIDKILPSLGLSEECNRAIIAHEGILGILLKTAIQLSEDRFQDEDNISDIINISISDLHIIYLNSLLSTDYLFKNI
ncbi:HDOD domain-containing protein [Marinomonas hwangdonensis]|uniref:HDOD domain-containing protein n=2 Tax=Marinomonas hwangdonensis TaxID=1053647 RepID=A0A3M8Q4P8_9GAMM|nr:HDOD domain-containing protein [Marinomonas hwangdonensis]